MSHVSAAPVQLLSAARHVPTCKDDWEPLQLANLDSTGSLHLRGWERLSNEGHGFSRAANSGVGEGFRQMGKRLLTKGMGSAVSPCACALDGFSR